MRNTLDALLIRHEGLRLKPYRCPSGKLTIGVGRNLEDVGISTSEAMFLLESDIYTCTKEALKFSWFSNLSDVRRDVVISMIFNIGYSGFLKFKKMIEAIEAKNYEKAADEMLASEWALQVGKRSYELSEMMRNDAYLS